MIEIACDSFDGPLDLLLALVRQNRYAPDQVPIGEITRQFEAYRQQASEADIELGGDFIETASWLVLLKSRSLLPHSPSAPDAPEQELARVLLDHATLKRTTGLLRDRLDAAGLVSGQHCEDAAALPPESAPLPSAPPTVQDLLDAARRALASAQAHTNSHAALSTQQAATVEAALADLERRISGLEMDRGTSTLPWFNDQPSTECKVALLLALLELARLSRVLLAQPQPFGPILLKPAGSPP